ncbi:hypothetical protein AMAG_13821 [Allomyces macrogynus ATCC 38327]|uniref:Uncharacterized protein n=1 Tax=Allomyces macrogynus (strain ATCC 38327) TaxID=578462 RepID=A0A0L0T265_ALLM3|nr:hypothetical protein AMAG_13821 [Allomyces macrogynus ATCC 38327]|eukprot:KNE68948.1 hypothetical protein AMAG_13821 [Allomyces macrogynus ATCC 38327]
MVMMWGMTAKALCSAIALLCATLLFASVFDPARAVVEAAAPTQFKPCAEFLYINMKPSIDNTTSQYMLAYNDPPVHSSLHAFARNRAVALRRNGLVVHEAAANATRASVRYGFQSLPVITFDSVLDQNADLVVEAKMGWIPRARKPVAGACELEKYQVAFFVDNVMVFREDWTTKTRPARATLVRGVVPRGIVKKALAKLATAQKQAAGQGTKPAGARFTVQFMQRNQRPTTPCLDTTSVWLRHLKLCFAHP